MSLKTTLKQLGYLPVNDFSPSYREHLQQFVIPMDNATFYAKIVDQEIHYQLTDGSIRPNRISLTFICILDDTTDTVIDHVCFPSYQLELRSNIELEVFDDLFGIYLNDKYVMGGSKFEYGLD